jgi:hypothetical protein
VFVTQSLAREPTHSAGYGARRGNFQKNQFRAGDIDYF